MSGTSLQARMYRERVTGLDEAPQSNLREAYGKIGGSKLRGEKKVEGTTGSQISKVLKILDDLRRPWQEETTLRTGALQNINFIIKDLKAIDRDRRKFEPGDGKVQINVSKTIKQLETTVSVLKQLGKDSTNEYKRLDKVLDKWLDENE